MKAHIGDSFFTFFKSLAANNHKDWFDSNRKNYEQNVKLPFELLVQNLIDEMGKSNKAYLLLQPKDCIFRINRDIRFSKDKTPYKLNRSAIIAPGGRKHLGSNGFYFEIGPGECALYAGAYAPDKPALLEIRRKIASNLKDFSKIIENDAFKSTFGEVRGEKQKRLDKEFKDAAELQTLIFNTQFYIMHKFDSATAMKPDFVTYLVSLYKTAIKFTEFLENTAENKTSQAK